MNGAPEQPRCQATEPDPAGNAADLRPMAARSPSGDSKKRTVAQHPCSTHCTVYPGATSATVAFLFGGGRNAGHEIAVSPTTAAVF